MSRSGIQITSSLLNERALLDSLNTTSTLMERLDQENIVKDIETRRELLNKDIYLNISSQASKEFFDNLKAAIDLNNLIIFNEKKELETSYEKFVEKVNLKKQVITSLTNTIRKKLNQLSFLSYKEPSVVLLEEFINMANIDSKTLPEKNRLNIDTSAEIASLPIKKISTHTIDNCFISKESNGIPGEYLDGQYKDIFAIFNGRPDSHFSYHRKDNGPLVLSITCSFKTKKIFNKLSIARSSITGSSGFTLIDATFSDEENNISIKNLVSVKNQSFKINSYMEQEALTIYHLPVKAEKITLFFKTDEFSTLTTGRKIFSLSIREIVFQLLEYEQSGSFSSTIQSIDEDFYSCSFKSVVHPKDEISYSKKVLLSVDGGSTFNQLDDDEFALDGAANRIQYIYDMERVDSNLSKSSYVQSEAYFPEIVSSTRNFTRDTRNSFVINKLNKKTLIAYQDKVAFVGSSKNKFIEMQGVVAGGSLALDTFVINNLNKLNFEFMCNNKILYKSSSNQIEKDNEYYLNSAKNKIIVSNELDGKKISFSCSINTRIISKPEGYYCELEVINFDLKNIEVLKNVIKEETLNLVQTETDIKPNAIKNSFIFKNIQNEQVSFLTENIDHINGKLIKPEGASTVTYKYIEKEKVQGGKVWFENQIPRGLFMEENLPIRRVDVKYNSTAKRYDHKTGLVEYIINNNLKKISFSDRNIIRGSVRINPTIFSNYKFEEIVFKNGSDEFLNLTEIEENVPPIEADESGYVYFALSKTPRSDVAIKVKGFSVERYGFVTNNICRIKLEDGDEISYQYSVSYKYQEAVESNLRRYSIDYEEGHVYFENDIVTSDEVLLSYGVFDGEVEYYIVNPIELNYENVNDENGIVEVFINSSDVISRNNSITFCWFKSKSSVILEDLEKYYSPIIYSTRLELK